MKTNWKMFCAFLLIVVQLGVVGYSIAGNNIIARTGTEYKFRVEPVDPYDIFRGRYVSFRLETDSSERFEKSFALIEVGADGFAKISGYTNDKPDADYITLGEYGAMPINRYYIDEKYAQAAEEYVRNTGASQLDDVYVIVRVKNGKPVVTGMFVGNEKIEGALAT